MSTAKVPHIMNFILASAAILPAVYAQGWAYLQFNATAAPPDNSETFLNAATTPNATHDVLFNLTDGNSLGQNWTWTVSITDVASSPTYENRTYDTASMNYTTQSITYPDYRQAYTTYDFSWPGMSENVNDAVRSSSSSSRPSISSACLWMVSATFSKNVSDKWDSSSSDCTSALGESCVAAIRSGISSDGGECNSRSFQSNRTFRESCASSFGSVTRGLTVVAFRKPLSAFRSTYGVCLLLTRTHSIRQFESGKSECTWW